MNVSKKSLLKTFKNAYSGVSNTVFTIMYILVVIAIVTIR